MDKIFELVQHKWVIIWWFTALIKWLIQLRKKDFNLLVFITDFVLAVIIGYVSFELVRESQEINFIVKLIFTAFMSWNAFVVVSIMFNKDLARKIFLNFFWKILEQDLKDKNKKDEN